MKYRYRYFGKCSDGKIWFIKSGNIYFIEKSRVKRFANIKEVLNSEELLNKLPNEVKKYLFQLVEKGHHFQPMKMNSFSTDEKGLNLDDLEFLKDVLQIFKKFFNMMEKNLCDNCNSKLIKEWSKLLKELNEKWELNKPVKSLYELIEEVENTLA